jgi:hypothetical protein
VLAINLQAEIALKGSSRGFVVDANDGRLTVSSDGTPATHEGVRYLVQSSPSKAIADMGAHFLKSDRWSNVNELRLSDGNTFTGAPTMAMARVEGSFAKLQSGHGLNWVVAASIPVGQYNSFLWPAMWYNGICSLLVVLLLVHDVYIHVHIEALQTHTRTPACIASSLYRTPPRAVVCIL